MKLKPVTLIAAICVFLSFTVSIGNMLMMGGGIMSLRYALAIALHDLPLCAFLLVLWQRQKDEA